MADCFYITTPIYYVNARPHLGHAYTTLVADAMARYQRALGKDTYFLTGTDEHGDKIVEAAEKAGQSPREYVDEISGLFQGLWPQLGISNDAFIRTTEPRHIAVVQAFLQKIHDAGDLYFGEYGGHYCTGCERFYTEKELVDGKCPQHLTAPTFIQEKNWFFRMSRHQAWLIEHIKKNPDFIRPRRYRNEVLSLLESGALEDLCISRPKSRLTWGIELPFDTNYVCYVWFDALLNYLTALEWPAGERMRYWNAAQHLIAKDILKPHAIFWPTMLHAAGMPVYRHLNVHGYWLVQDTKMSKSLGNVVAPLDMAAKYGLDAFRYFIYREMHFGSDASFSEEALVARINADLANDLGNCCNRVLSMTQKFCGGVVPVCGPFTEEDDALVELGLNAATNFQQLFGQMEFSKALEALWELVRACNKFVDQAKPWALAKAGDQQRLDTVLYVLLEALRKVARHLLPVMPTAAATLLTQLGCDPDRLPPLQDEVRGWNGLTAGTALAAVSTLFPRVEPPTAPEPAEAAPAASKAPPKDKKAAKKKEPAPPPAEIEFEDFQKLDLRVGTVLAVDKHPDADKLLLVQVDLGEAAPRQVVAGIAAFFAPDALIGRQVVVVANLKPRELRGHTSHGMIVAVRTPEGMELLTASGPVPTGSKAS
ncbi:methionine--tRNA ligase [Megalodesulfovibrio gigas]|uniref:Methionine--tRNA ligase n=1 Tax=Megalodesulfovibrio gigas (strain ATCC 19364 / DSM 1382 / NCIMB 9332 / VKM B-1759) TaxID=1121448 RepID=T2GBL0_MEGG1|nr:methionine--tRNA ligase [Megalodesulfovibrio gigas]AGW13549.1 putative methionyl-tRNA synthetase [Megalodesulfovibrio gigas DSM 1382 = ATCC 19364]